MKVAPADSNITIDVSPRDSTYCDLDIALGIQMKGHFANANLSALVTGTERYKCNQNKEVKYTFYRRSIDERVITILPDTLINHKYFHSFANTKHPSSFTYTNFDKEVTASIQYKLKVTITNRNEKLLFKKSIALPYCAYEDFNAKASFTHTLFQETITFRVKLDNEKYKANERILCKCNVTKPVWDICTDLSKLTMHCKLRQTLTFTEPTLYLFNNSVSHMNDLVDIEYRVSAIPDYLDPSVAEFPVWIDLEAVDLVSGLGTATKGEYLKNEYSLVFEVKMEDGRTRVESFSIPLLIKAV
eukprot:TRINITY_DN4547_c0_g1_i1.p1 TRINITY_DN4547_c0_g1~~TRINITY_DN4547_c0_g1_i1.p1  ORF type:complete len:301 (+),score=33.84 TRINITY_DN4547_c0_g1_i1:141-1043(+)